MGSKIQDVTDADFETEVRQASKTIPVLVEFWAEWCGPCRMFAVILEQLVEQFGDRIKFTKLDIDKNPQTPAMLGIRGIPVVLLFKDGEPVMTHVGATSLSAMRTLIQKFLE